MGVKWRRDDCGCCSKCNLFSIQHKIKLKKEKKSEISNLPQKIKLNNLEGYKNYKRMFKENFLEHLSLIALVIKKQTSDTRKPIIANLKLGVTFRYKHNETSFLKNLQQVSMFLWIKFIENIKYVYQLKENKFQQIDDAHYRYYTIQFLWIQEIVFN